MTERLPKLDKIEVVPASGVAQEDKGKINLDGIEVSSVVRTPSGLTQGVNLILHNAGVVRGPNNGSVTIYVEPHDYERQQGEPAAQKKNGGTS